MTRRWCLAVALVVIAIVTLCFISPSGRWRAIGWVKGEVFYQGRPASYWLGVVKDWNALFKDCRLEGVIAIRPVTPPSPPPAFHKKVYALLMTAFSEDFPGPPRGDDPAAVPVLIELLSNEDAEVREYAASELGSGPKAPAAAPPIDNPLRPKP